MKKMKPLKSNNKTFNKKGNKKPKYPTNDTMADAPVVRREPSKYKPKTTKNHSDVASNHSKGRQKRTDILNALIQIPTLLANVDYTKADHKKKFSDFTGFFTGLLDENDANIAKSLGYALASNERFIKAFDSQSFVTSFTTICNLLSKDGYKFIQHLIYSFSCAKTKHLNFITDEEDKRKSALTQTAGTTYAASKGILNIAGYDLDVVRERSGIIYFTSDSSNCILDAYDFTALMIFCELFNILGERNYVYRLFKNVIEGYIKNRVDTSHTTNLAAFVK